jgi:hypothetical protein
MASPRVEATVNLIRGILPVFGTLDKAVEQARHQLRALGAFDEHDLEAARGILESEFKEIEILREYSIHHRKAKWYFGPSPHHKHWPAYRDYLRGVKDWPDSSISMIDTASNEVVSLLDNPTLDSFSCRGLVLGHVQSGKTANMTAVIAKAADSGYTAIIILAGLTNKLRLQTQRRMMKDLVERYPESWDVQSPDEEIGDYRSPIRGGFHMPAERTMIAIVKKNTSPLRRLKETIKRTSKAIRAAHRFLVIDDECDQASINTARGETDMTAINQAIREMLSQLPCVTYVGYSATPFANVLINPYRIPDVELDDLYPKDFISSLPRPAGYFGTEQLFGRVPDDPDNPLPEEDGLDVIRVVPEADRDALLPGKGKQAGFVPLMVKSLEESILYFIACCAARIARGDADKHMTMLVHVSVLNALHDSQARLIREWLATHEALISNPDSVIGQRLRRVWDHEMATAHGYAGTTDPVGYMELLPHLKTALDKVEIAIENMLSRQRIDYEGSSRIYIVIGGMVLSRGLTLEGLMVSYFLRTSSQYDTLLQMGRWFGFRRGYEDLPRIWMPQDLALKFRALAGIESEIREEIDQYRTQELTPLDIAVRIRTVPGMAITAANRMRSARRCSISFWSTHRQTFRFEHKNPQVVENNWRAASILVQGCEDRGRRTQPIQGRLWTNVPRAVVREFLSDYCVHPTHADLGGGILTGFLDTTDSRLDQFNVGIVEPSKGNLSHKALGSAGSIRMVNRAQLKDCEDTADIKALMSRADILFDCRDRLEPTGTWENLKEARQQVIGSVPLLLLYVIDRDSMPQGSSEHRKALDAVDDLIGYGIVFPGRRDEQGDYVSVELQPETPEEIEEREEEEREQARLGEDYEF